MDLEKTNFCILLDDESSVCLSNNWLTPEELEKRSRTQVRHTALQHAPTSENILPSPIVQYNIPHIMPTPTPLQLSPSNDSPRIPPSLSIK